MVKPKKPPIVENQPPEPPIIDLESKLKEWLKKGYQASIGNPRFLEGEGSLKLKREPLTVKQEPTITETQLDRDRMRAKPTKGSWLVGEQGIT